MTDPTPTDDHHHVVMFSGGVGSWATARRVADTHGTTNLTLLTADTNTESPDWRPFVDACHRNTGGRLVILDNDGQDIWDVFNDNQFIGNSRADVCSRVLKREPLRRWLETNHDPATTVVYLGFDWTEAHRLERARLHWEPWRTASPLCDPPYRQKAELLADLDAAGIPRPALYGEGFPHNNCGGACVKAGQAQWRKLLTIHPDRFDHHEQQEQAFRDRTGKDVSILRDRTGGTTTPLTLRDLRLRLQRNPTLFDDGDWGACSCMESGPDS